MRRTAWLRGLPGTPRKPSACLSVRGAVVAQDREFHVHMLHKSLSDFLLLRAAPEHRVCRGQGDDAILLRKYALLKTSEGEEEVRADPYSTKYAIAHATDAADWDALTGICTDLKFWGRVFELGHAFGVIEQLEEAVRASAQAAASAPAGAPPLASSAAEPSASAVIPAAARRGTDVRGGSALGSAGGALHARRPAVRHPTSFRRPGTVRHPRNRAPLRREGRRAPSAAASAPQPALRMASGRWCCPNASDPSS